MNALNVRAFLGLLLLLLAMAALLFIPAWTLDYWQAWVFLAVYFAASLAITLYLMKKDPQLLARRMSGGPMAEKEPAQRIIMVLASLGFIGLIVLLLVALIPILGGLVIFCALLFGMGATTIAVVGNRRAEVAAA